MSDALGFFQFGLAFAQVAKHQEAGQGVFQPSARLLEKTLLLLRPVPRVRALVQPEHVRLVHLRGESHFHDPLDAESPPHRCPNPMLPPRPHPPPPPHSPPRPTTITLSPLHGHT